jgi:hypothetical protein
LTTLISRLLKLTFLTKPLSTMLKLAFLTTPPINPPTLSQLVSELFSYCLVIEQIINLDFLLMLPADWIKRNNINLITKHSKTAAFGSNR